MVSVTCSEDFVLWFCYCVGVQLLTQMSSDFVLVVTFYFPSLVNPWANCHPDLSPLLFPNLIFQKKIIWVVSLLCGNSMPPSQNNNLLFDSFIVILVIKIFYFFYYYRLVLFIYFFMYRIDQSVTFILGAFKFHLILWRVPTSVWNVHCLRSLWVPLRNPLRVERPPVMAPNVHLKLTLLFPCSHFSASFFLLHQIQCCPLLAVLIVSIPTWVNRSLSALPSVFHCLCFPPNRLLFVLDRLSAPP